MPKKTETKAPAAKGGKDTKKVQKNYLPILGEKKPRNWGIGQAVQPKRDLTRFVKWPKYVRLQRQKRILLQRLKVPPTVNQFTKTLDKSSATLLFKLLHKYRPETRRAKKQRLLEAAKASKDGKKEGQQETSKPNLVKYGLNHVTGLIEKKQAKLVVIAHDVDPIELVVWLPTLCRKMDVPYCIVKGKSRLGAVVHKKKATALVLTNVNKEDKNDFNQLVQTAGDSYNRNTDIRRMWGGGKLGSKSVAATRKKEKAIAKEKMHL